MAPPGTSLPITPLDPRVDTSALEAEATSYTIPLDKVDESLPFPLDNDGYVGTDPEDESLETVTEGRNGQRRRKRDLLWPEHVMPLGLIEESPEEEWKKEVEKRIEELWEALPEKEERFGKYLSAEECKEQIIVSSPEAWEELKEGLLPERIDVVEVRTGTREVEFMRFTLADRDPLIVTRVKCPNLKPELADKKTHIVLSEITNETKTVITYRNDGTEKNVIKIQETPGERLTIYESPFGVVPDTEALESSDWDPFRDYLPTNPIPLWPENLMLGGSFEASPKEERDKGAEVRMNEIYNALPYKKTFDKFRFEEICHEGFIVHPRDKWVPMTADRKPEQIEIVRVQTGTRTIEFKRITMTYDESFEVIEVQCPNTNPVRPNELTLIQLIRITRTDHKLFNFPESGTVAKKQLTPLATYFINERPGEEPGYGKMGAPSGWDPFENYMPDSNQITDENKIPYSPFYFEPQIASETSEVEGTPEDTEETPESSDSVSGDIEETGQDTDPEGISDSPDAINPDEINPEDEEIITTLNDDTVKEMPDNIVFGVGAEFAPGHMRGNDQLTLGGSSQSLNLRGGYRFTFLDANPKGNLYLKPELLLGYGRSQYHLENSDSPNGTLGVRTNDFTAGTQATFLYSNERGLYAVGGGLRAGFSYTPLNTQSESYLRHGSAGFISENESLEAPGFFWGAVVEAGVLNGGILFDFGFQSQQKRHMTGNNVFVGSAGNEVEGYSRIPLSADNFIFGLYFTEALIMRKD